MKPIPPTTTDTVIETLFDEAVQALLLNRRSIGILSERSTSSPIETQADHCELPAVTALRMLIIKVEEEEELDTRRAPDRDIYRNSQGVVDPSPSLTSFPQPSG